MNADDRAKFISDFIESNCYKLLKSKGDAYSRGESDVNSNFKRLASELFTTPEKILWVYLKKHLDAIVFYINTGRDDSEPIDGRIADAVNYLLILASIISESKQKV